MAALHADLHNDANAFEWAALAQREARLSGSTQYIAHEPVLAMYNAGDSLNVDVFVPNGQSYTSVAFLSGYMIDYP